jgi:hypothetical protein
MIKEAIGKLSSYSNGKHTFKRDKWDIVFNIKNNSILDSWEVYEEGVLFRKISNQLLPIETLSMSTLPEISPNRRVQSMEDAFKGLGKTPSLGIFFARKETGDYIAALVLKGSPAGEAGIIKDDAILKLNGTSITNMPLADVKKIIDAKNDVQITIRNKNGSVFEKTLKKAVINN